MDELTLNIIYKGEGMELPVRAYAYGYTYRIDINIGDEVVIFEPDEEGSYRAFADEKTDKELLALIVAELEKLK